MKLNIFFIKELIPYEGVNVWIVVAKDAKMAKETLETNLNFEKPNDWWNTSIEKLCTTNDYDKPQVIYSVY